MSAGTKVPWAEAAELAKQLVDELAEAVVRVKTVGSVRRRREMVGDIELLVEPRVSGDLFGGEGPDLDAVRHVARGWGRLLKNGDRFLQVRRWDGTNIDLFLCHPPAQWGSLLAIRTGPVELSRHAVTCMLGRGFRHERGFVMGQDKQVVPTPEEEDFFRLAGLPCLPPRLRHTPAAFKALS